MKIKDFAAVVTGGASGMGAATARMLAENGANVTLLDMNQETGTRMAAEINGLFIQCDVTKPEQVEAALQKATNQHGAARFYINCAGIVHARRMVNQQGPMPLAEFERVLDINVVGTFNVMRLGAASMQQLSPEGASGERGVIINTASIAAFEGQIGQTAYSASKGAIVSMTLPAARELASAGIRVMTIAPGLVDTPMFSQLSTEARASLATMVPFPKRLAHPEEYAALVKFIIENEMLNGEVIRLDGAIRMQPK